MPAFAPGQARGLSPPEPGAGRFARVRASRLGFLLCAALLACANADPHRLASDDDRRYGTRLFTWVVEHDPSALVAWNVDPALLRPLTRGRIALAGPRPCAQAARAHAALVVLTGPADAALRDRARDCGFALWHDPGGLAIAPR